MFDISFLVNNDECIRSLERNGFSLMTRVAEMYAVRDTNDIVAHCETLNRVSEKRRRNTAVQIHVLRRIATTLTAVSAEIENANYESYSADGGMMTEIIKAVSDTIMTVNNDADLTAMFYQTIMRMRVWRWKWVSYFYQRRSKGGRPNRAIRTARACENSQIK